MKNLALVIVCVNDEISNKVCKSLEMVGIRYNVAKSGTQVIGLLEEKEYDIVIAHFSSPVGRIREWVDKMRKLTSAPILALIDANFEPDELIKCMEIVDDCQLMPFNKSELAARTKALIRHPKAPWRSINAPMLIKADEIGIMPEYHRVFVSGEEISLTKTEYNILLLFVQYPGMLFTRQQIYDYAWHELAPPGIEKTVTNHVQRIKKKLAQVSKINFISTVYGLGYKLNKM